MKQWYFPLLSCVFLFSSFAGVCDAEEMIKDKLTGKAFPLTVAFTYDGNNYDLKMTGMANRRKMHIKIYSIAHYMQDPAKLDLQKGNLYDEIIHSNQPKEMMVQWVMNIDRERFYKGYRESFEKNISPELARELKPIFDQFLTFFGKVRKNDTQVIRSLPGGTIIVEINGEETGRLQNEPFAKALWNIWFGPKSVVNRKKLVSQL